MDELLTAHPRLGIAAVLNTRLARHAPETVRHLVVCALSGALMAGCVIAQAALLAHALSALVVPVALVAVVAVRALLAWAQELAAHRAAARITSRLRSRLLAHMVRVGPLPRPGEPADFVTGGIDAVHPYFARYLPRLATAVIVPLSALVALAVADFAAAGMVLVTLPLVPLLGGLIGMYGAARAVRRRRTLERLAGHFTDMVAGLPTLKVYGGARAQTQEIARVTEQYRRASMEISRFAVCSALVVDVAATLTAAAVAVSVSLRLASGALTVETALFVLLLVPEAYLPLRRLAAHLHAGRDGLAAAHRVFALLEASTGPATRTTARSRLSGGGPPDVRALGLRVEGLVIAHDGRAPIGPVSLTLAPGTATAFAGPPGPGTSSLIAAILGFVAPLSGRIMVGDRELVPDDGWRRLITWVPRRPALFAGTVEDNIAIMVPGAVPDAVRKAAAATGVSAFTRLDAVLGPGGAGLSAEQRQRLALTRAVLRCEVLGTPLLLLDDPTAHLDVRTEIEASEVIRDLLPGRTALIVTHRQTLLGHADRVVPFGAVPMAVPA